MITRKFTSSPFKLRRSIVPQGEGGAYETGGYDPNAYDASGQIMSASIEGMSKTIGAALGSITKSDINKMDVADNERRKGRIDKIDEKIKKQTKTEKQQVVTSMKPTPVITEQDVDVVSNKGKKLQERKARIENRIKKTDERIKEYESVYGKNFTSNDFLNNQRRN